MTLKHRSSPAGQEEAISAAVLDISEAVSGQRGCTTCCLDGVALGAQEERSVVAMMGSKVGQRKSGHC